MPSSTIFRQHTRLNAATNKTTKKISHTRRSPKDRNYPSTPFGKLPYLLSDIRIGDYPVVSVSRLVPAASLNSLPLVFLIESKHSKIGYEELINTLEQAMNKFS
jgi:hypothetical protein